MSRRKQSNPKPIKRLSDGEDGEDEVEDKINTNVRVKGEVLMDQSESSHELSADEKEFASSDNDIEHENKAEIRDKVKCPILDPERCEDEQDDGQIIQNDFKKSLNFPNDILLFKKLDEAESAQTGREYIVCTIIPLPKNSGLGPFPGELVSLSSIKQGDLVLQAQAESGETQFVRVLDQAGSWLSQLRPAPSETSKNCRVHFQGGRIWCDIVSNVEAESELIASFTIGTDPDVKEQTSPKRDDNIMEVKIKTEIDEDLREEKPAVSVKETRVITPPSKIQQNNHAALLYGCPFCGVRFSSARTLEGHLTYYCSKKPVDFMSVPAVQDGCKTDEPMEESGSENKPSSPAESADGKENRMDKSDSSSENASELGSPVVKSIKTGDIYKCPYCSYTADKTSSLNRHKRIHNRGNNSDELIKYALPIPKNETYCKDCNIQFSSLGTYKCHKEYYCSKRDTTTGSGSDSSPSPRGTMNVSPVGTSSNIFNENLSSLKPDDLKKMISVTSGSMISGQTRVLLAPPILAPNGVGDMNLGIPTVIVQPIVATTSAIAAHQSSLKENTKKSISPGEQPLDLSTPRKDDKRESMEESRPLSSKSVESSVTMDSVKIKEEQEPKTLQLSPKTKAPATPTSESSKSPNNSEGLSSSAQKTLPEMPPLMSIHQLPYMCGKPIPPMLQSVSKCSECNIVFYKHENYLIHKKHYCSSRRGKMESPETFDTESSNDSYTLVNQTSHAKEDFSTIQGSTPVETKMSTKDCVESLSPRLKSPRTENKVPDEVFYKYYCVPCKIKFSSSSTLKAHKEFYCPHGKESVKALAEKKTLEDIGNSSIDSEEGVFKCDRCESEFVSARLLKLHFCTGISSLTPLLRCPYCEFVTQVDSRISEHMKVHMPNKVYRCTLCRYRGNTVRGMRMHGKMHVDNGEDFTDENMIEIEEPPLIPVKLNSAGDNRPVDIETELIRLKNEPYKRRRSRKSFEKSEHSSSVSNMCMFCGQTFKDLSSFALHLKIHEMIALQAASARNVKCQYCDQVLDTFDDLMQHIQIKHKDKIISEQRSPSSQGQSSRSNSRSSLSNSRPGSVDQNDSNDSITQKEKIHPHPVRLNQVTSADNDSKCNDDSDLNGRSPFHISIKQEPLDCSYQHTVKSSKYDIDKIKLGDSVKCITPKRERLPSQSDSVNCTTPKKERPSSASSNETELNSPNEHSNLLSPSPLVSSEQIKRESPNTKSETKLNGTQNHSPPINIPVFDPNPPVYDPQQMVPYYQLLPNVHGLSHLVSVSLQNSSSRSEKPTSKYCTHCDIRFTYQSSYLAHKKYYCSATTSEEPASTKV